MINHLLDTVIGNFGFIDLKSQTEHNIIKIQNSDVIIDLSYMANYDGILLKSTPDSGQFIAIETTTFGIFKDGAVTAKLIPYYEIVDADTHFQYSTIFDLTNISVQMCEKVAKIRTHFDGLYNN